MKKSRGFPYIPHTEEDIRRMCRAVGVGSVDELLDIFPAGLRLKGPLNLPDGLSEQEVKGLLEKISAGNSTTADYSSFLGAGAYNHYIPSAIDRIISRSEFYTSYTPYQPEVSQGTLQAIFEYQTLICQMTGMEVSNASLYDGASATAEAVLMARRITAKKKVILSSALHPEYRQVARTYLSGAGDGIEEVFYCTEKGTTLPEAVKAVMDNDTACLVVQHPNFFGCCEDVAALADIVHEKKALLIVTVTEPLSLGILRPPGETGCDIVAGEAQSFGIPLNYGGPHLGFMATGGRNSRQMPGRIVGQTIDRKGARSFCLTMATREQHIRREKATSNICTNQGLNALACAVYLALLGKGGLVELARLNLSKAHYLKERLAAVGVKTAFSSPFFNEFVIETEEPAKQPASTASQPSSTERFLKTLLKKGIIGGLSLKRFYPSLDRHVLVTATEMNSKEEIDGYAAVVADVFLKA
ncbi:MAG: aminomethyl-transferring glycine dehydrogenase subunit GcvPA [Deltaproteobacteria bacterium]|nr:aminomethyl-transferring glycine dehydrogenase subunit GcvPA [Deltaproteobacteria bacterium]